MAKSRTQSQDWQDTARILSESLPYLQRYDGATIVIKFGGNAMGDDEAMDQFARDIVLMKHFNINPVVVHGGGPMIDAMLKKTGIVSERVDGQRVTSAEAIGIVEMVLSGQVNKRIVQALNKQGGKAVGLSGKDASLMICEKDVRRATRDGVETEIDLGFVGRPVEMNPEVLFSVMEADFIPVVAPIGAGTNGETFNVNADTAAGAIAAAMNAERLLLLTDVGGVQGAAGEIVTELNATDVKDLTVAGVIAGGMIPKTETALAAIDGGVGAVVILKGTTPHAVLLELFTSHGAGSLIKK
jgi:acetylglutamate kinase